MPGALPGQNPLSYPNKTTLNGKSKCAFFELKLFKTSSYIAFWKLTQDKFLNALFYLTSNDSVFKNLVLPLDSKITSFS